MQKFPLQKFALQKIMFFLGTMGTIEDNENEWEIFIISDSVKLSENIFNSSIKENSWLYLHFYLSLLGQIKSWWQYT